MKKRPIYTGIFEGWTYKIANIKTGVDIDKKPYWCFCVPISKQVYGEMQVIEYAWVLVHDICKYENGEFVKITKMTGWKPFLKTLPNGTNRTYHYFYCEVEKSEFENREN